MASEKKESWAHWRVRHEGLLKRVIEENIEGSNRKEKPRTEYIN